jgi:hypothetical protein
LDSRVIDEVRYPGARIADDIDHCCAMVSYGAQNGKLLDEYDLRVVSKVLIAQRDHTWDPEIESAFYASMSRIAHSVAPVVAATASDHARISARRTIRFYTLQAVALSFAVVFLSCMLFISNQIADDVTAIVKRNDAAALSLHNNLQALAAMDIRDENAVVEARSLLALQIQGELQSFATNNRQLFTDVSRINWATTAIGASAIRNPYQQTCAGDKSVIRRDGNDRSLGASEHVDARKAGDWQCDPELAREVLEIAPTSLAAPFNGGKDAHPPNVQDTVNQGFQKIAVYQDIRAMALYANAIILSLVGAVTGFILPVLYAWLGACAAILGRLRAESLANTFHPDNSKVANRAHEASAVIVGIAIGLFSGLREGGTDVSPLAFAFLAGYVSDKFFFLVDRLVQSLTGNPGQPTSEVPAPPPSKND